MFPKWHAKILLLVLLTAGSIVMLFPFFWMLTTAVKRSDQVYSIPPIIIPEEWNWGNFGVAWNSAPFTVFLLNSLFVSLLSTFMVIFFSSLAGYALAKFDFAGKSLFMVLILSTMMVPGQITMIPVYLLLRDVHLLNSHFGLMLIAVSSGFGTFLMKQFISQLPDEILQAARIDGCQEVTIYYKIVVPLIKPALAALAIFVFMGTWDSFFWPLIVLDSQDKFTLPLGLARFQGEYSIDIRMVMSISLIMTIPVLLFFLVFQRSFISGITFSAVKG